jgi:hypothetical protein
MWGKPANLSPRFEEALDDCLFLALIVRLSLTVYVGDLGFYSDDWDFLRRFSLSPNQSLVGLFQQKVLTHIRQQLPVLPDGVTLILDGVCRYSRGADFRV